LSDAGFLIDVASFPQKICEKAVGNGFNLTIPTAAQISMNATATANASGTATVKTSKKSAALSLQPPIAHIITGCLTLSVVVAGSTLLL